MNNTNKIMVMDESVKDILCNIMAQMNGYNLDIDCHGVRLSELVEIVEYLVNQTSKLKSTLLEMPTKESEIN